jgi:hypothetical protein
VYEKGQRELVLLPVIMLDYAKINYFWELSCRSHFFARFNRL